MRNLSRIAFFIILIIWAFPIGLLATAETQNGTVKKLLLMHPTINTLSTIHYLIENKIFPVENLELTGIYYYRESYDYNQSLTYISENKLDINLIKIEGDLNPGNIFQTNPCTPEFRNLFNMSAGIIFFGGPDIPPALYGESTNTLTVITDPYRHYFEASFLFHLLGGYQDLNFVPLLEQRPEYMVLGFCLGMQTMNVALGGTLIQDIPLELYNQQSVEQILDSPPNQQHRNYAVNIEDSADLFWGNIHQIRILPQSWILLEGITETEICPAVVSSHHQAIENLGKDLRVTATSMDSNVIEAIDHRKYKNVYGFQFHPEASDIYNYGNLQKLKSDSPGTSLRSMIESGQGYEFHLALWKKFAEILNDE